MGYWYISASLPKFYAFIGRYIKMNIIIDTRQTKDLNEAERSAIVGLCTEAHQVDFGSLFSFLPPDGLHVLAYGDGQLVSHAVVTTRWLQPNNLRLLKTAYVDAVATDPAYQGQGIGSSVMRHLASVIQEYELACLETERVSFYTQVGWEEWRGPLAGRNGTELLPTPDQKGIMILRLAHTPPLNLNSSLTVEYDGRIW
jgi:aminoglycoside 2'-N-acetyltransferase I